MAFLSLKRVLPMIYINISEHEYAADHNTHLTREYLIATPPPPPPAIFRFGCVVYTAFVNPTSIKSSPFTQAALSTICRFSNMHFSVSHPSTSLAFYFLPVKFKIGSKAVGNGLKLIYQWFSIKSLGFKWYLWRKLMKKLLDKHNQALKWFKYGNRLGVTCIFVKLTEIVWFSWVVAAIMVCTTRQN